MHTLRELLLSLYDIDSGAQTQVGRRGSKHLYPLIHLVGWYTIFLRCLFVNIMIRNFIFMFIEDFD